MAAPVTAVVATDLKFFEHFPRLFPERAEMFTKMFAGMPEPARRSRAWDNALLQMAYFIIALRSVGPDGRFFLQYLINIGYADNAGAFPRLPRFHAANVARYA